MPLPIQHIVALAVGYLADLAFGDPHWLPHPIRAIGKLIELVERLVRAVFPTTPTGERAAGVVLVVLVCAISTGVCVLIIWLCSLVAWWLALIAQCVICYQMLAARSLRVESNKVRERLVAGDLDGARRAVGMIVGRDTDALSVEGVVKATVETVAENTSDGVISPLIFMGIGGAPLGVLYKSINTMDSMIGYRNDRYRYLGTAAAKLDDVVNYIPARLGALLMCAAAAICCMDARGAWRIWRRDHAKHLSPNSAHTESACAGALGVELGGPNLYFGKLVDKPTMGDPVREVEVADIARANRLMYATSVLALVIALAISALLAVLAGLV